MLDTLYKIRGISDLRINELAYEELNRDVLSSLAPYYRSTMINTLIMHGRII
ncbi:MAG: hypothetical protein ACOX0D_10910 [Sphaerochaeta sp.]